MISSYIFGSLWILFFVILIMIFRWCKECDDWVGFWLYLFAIGSILCLTSSFVMIKSTTTDITNQIERQYYKIQNDTYCLFGDKNSTRAVFLGKNLTKEQLEEFKKKPVTLIERDSFWIKKAVVNVAYP